MVRSVVVFEDHSLDNFRPLALSVPAYEIRWGMFNLRERVELVTSDLSPGSGAGTLLCRSSLELLHTCDRWHINPENGPLGKTEQDRFLWLNGRCASQFGEISELIKGASSDGGFVCTDEHGLVAADLSAKESHELWQSWCHWQNQAGEEPRWLGGQILPSLPDPAISVSGLGYIWDIVPATREFLHQDISYVSDGKPYSRRPFGIFPAEENSDAYWLGETSLIQAVEAGDKIWLGADVKIAKNTAFDTSKGPIILDSGVTIMPHCFLEGPLYVGPGSTIKAGATIYGESSFGIGNRLSGEIGESTFSDFANKQHDGFIGHAVLGSWVNLGAMTTCSDLKNNYGDVRMDLGSGTVNTGLRFVGLMMGDHAKTAIGTLFNTGTCVGFASNIFGGVMPPKFVCNYSWGGLPDSPSYDVEKAIETAAIVMSRRGCRLSEQGKALMKILA